VRPNILLIITDQQRFDSPGFACAGAPSDTPALDALAGRGTVFETAYSSSTTCVPARVSLLTGLLPHRVPVTGRINALREGFWTIGRALRDSGYDTAWFGKLHMDPLHADHGFTRTALCEHLGAGYAREDRDDYADWIEAQGLRDTRSTRPGRPRTFPYAQEFHPTHWITGHALDFLAARRGPRPFFAVVSYAHPHTPYDPPEPWASACRAQDQAVPEVPPGVDDGLPAVFREAARSFDPSGRFPLARTEQRGPPHVRSVLAAIRALVRQIDDAVGRLLERVDLERTVVIFTSDHGDFGGHRGLLGKIPWIPYDDLARVALFAAGAGVRAGHRVDTLVQSFDLVPTLLELADVPYPFAGIDSLSLAPQLAGAAGDAQRIAVCETRMGWPMIRRGRLKHIWHFMSDSQVLFDLQDDPRETRNLAGEALHAGMLRENRERIHALLSAGLLDSP
jgi:choline-sulfatase